MKADGSDRGERCCCFCGHNIRSGDIGKVKCNCEIDGHYIGYVACFESWCKHWCKAKKINS